MVYDETIFSTCPSAAKIILVPAGDYYISLFVLRPIRLPMLRVELAHVTETPEICKTGSSSCLML